MRKRGALGAPNMATSLNGLLQALDLPDRPLLKKRNDFSPPRYTIFYHLLYMARWSPTLFYFLKIKKL
jgi:hypothetical protein